MNIVHAPFCPITVGEEPCTCGGGREQTTEERKAAAMARYDQLVADLEAMKSSSDLLLGTRQRIFKALQILKK